MPENPHYNANKRTRYARAEPRQPRFSSANLIRFKEITVIAFDADFVGRTEAMLRLRRSWRVLPPDPQARATTPQSPSLDGRREGETYRAIGQVLLAAGRDLDDQSSKSHDVRSRVIRLVKDGEKLMPGRYRELLRMPYPKGEAAQ